MTSEEVNGNMETKINDISDYIKEIQRIMENYSDEIVVFRGEDQIYDDPCKPNIFRKTVLGKDNYFEKNLLDSMRQNKLSADEKYLHNAIDAQHGEFPSRLLDVTYNCLVALYFAVTPFYRNADDINDSKPGAVYIFHFENAYNPSSDNINCCYNSLISRDNKVFSENIIFGKSHKFVDHCKINNRIIAQQGAFILFQGDAAEPLPICLYDKVVIPGDSKKRIRNDLRLLFGIHTGSIYPEINNLVQELSEKSKKIIARDFTIETEIDGILETLDLELTYFLDISVETSDNKAKSEWIGRVAEKTIFSYYLGILQLKEYLNKEYDGKDKKNMIECEETLVKGFESRLSEFKKLLKKYGIDGMRLDDFVVEGKNENKQ